MTAKSTTMFYFDDFVHREGQFTYIPATNEDGLQISKQRRFVLFLNDAMYDIDVMSHTGEKTSLPPLSNEETQKSLGGIQSGKDAFLGYDCDVWTVESRGMTTCLLEGVILYSRTKIDGIESVTEATEVSLNVPIPAENFEALRDVTITNSLEPSGQPFSSAVSDPVDLSSPATAFIACREAFRDVRIDVLRNCVSARLLEDWRRDSDTYIGMWQTAFRICGGFDRTILGVRDPLTYPPSQPVDPNVAYISFEPAGGCQSDLRMINENDEWKFDER